MAQKNNITIAFKSSGAPALKTAIKALADEQDRLNKKFKSYVKQTKKGEMGNRILANSFATIRAKMLLASFAMSMGIKQLIGFTKEASKVDSMSRAFNTLAGATEDSSTALQKLKEATNGTMSQFDLFQQANNAMILGVSKNSDEMAKMFDVAQRLGRALGRDTKSSVESLITGIGRQSRLMLDNIGIIVKADEAYKSFAKEIDTTADKLTDVQKKQAFNEEAMKKAEEAVKRLGAETLSTQDKFDQFGATLDNFQSHVGRKVTPVILGFLDGTAQFMREIMETDLETATRQLSEIGVELENLTGLQRAIEIESAFSAIKENSKDIEDSIKGVGLQITYLTDEQLESLGAVFEQKVSGGILEGSKQVTSFVKAFDPMKVTSSQVTSLLNDINEEANDLASVVDLSEADERRIKQLAIQAKQLSGILANIKSIEHAQKIISKSPAEVISGGDDGSKNANIQAESKFTDDLVKAKGNLLALSQVAFEGTARELDLNKVKVQLTEQQTKIDAKNLSLKEKMTDANEQDKAVLEAIIEVNQRAETQLDANAISERNAINAKHDLIDALKLEETQKLLIAAMADGELIFNEEKAISEQKILELQAALNLEGANTLSINKQIFAEKKKLISLEAQEAQQKLKNYSKIAGGLAGLNDAMKGSMKVTVRLQQIQAMVDAYAGAQSGWAMNKKVYPFPIPELLYAADIATGLAQARALSTSIGDKFEQGGLVGGRRHSQGGTMIEAEQGEFVMSRNAVNAVGIEAMNRINQGGGAGAVNISFSGNVMSQDFIEDEAIPMIKEAIRRGADIGVA
jgi:hypothetical protein